MIVSRALFVFAVAMFFGCATSSGTGVGNSRILLRDEIVTSGISGSAYDVISRLRPGFLVSRGQTTLSASNPTAAYPNVYLDGVPFGDINTLRNIDATQIAEIRMFEAWDAQTKFGMGNNGGVIAITTRR